MDTLTGFLYSTGLDSPIAETKAGERAKGGLEGHILHSRKVDMFSKTRDIWRQRSRVKKKMLLALYRIIQWLCVSRMRRPRLAMMLKYQQWWESEGHLHQDK